MSVKVKLHQGAIMPVKKSSEASGFDISSLLSYLIAPGERVPIRTGLSFELPIDWEMQVRPRSGLAIEGIDVIFGTLDSDYRGELFVIMHNHSKENFVVKPGMRIAQVVVATTLVQPIFESVKELGTTERGESGLGSTGV